MTPDNFEEESKNVETQRKTSKSNTAVIENPRLLENQNFIPTFSRMLSINQKFSSRESIDDNELRDDDGTRKRSSIILF